MNIPACPKHTTGGGPCYCPGSAAAASRPILDACCGSRMMWFDRQHPDVVYGDKRSETITVTDRSHGRADGQRTLRIEPDVLMDFRSLPYPDDVVREGFPEWTPEQFVAMLVEHYGVSPSATVNRIQFEYL